MHNKILVVDDNNVICNCVVSDLMDRGFCAQACYSARELFKKLKERSFDLIILDMKLKDGNAIDCIIKMKKESIETKVIVITGYSSIKNAVMCIKKGAIDYIEKPIDMDLLENSINKALEAKSDISTKKKDSDVCEKEIFIGESKEMKDIIDVVSNISKSNASVFIHGESGVGKEVIARLIHNSSERNKFSLVPINCAAIPDALIESELFGYTKGAFTGADSEKIGKFEYADNGTMLLDEITEMPQILQAKLLRVIQEKELSKLGSNKEKGIDVRFIATSNRDLPNAIKKGALREDLFYRLNVFNIKIPSLRERREDILPMSDMFVRKFSKKYKRSVKKISTNSCKTLLNHLWPGNIRELANVIERSVIMNKEESKEINIVWQQ